MLELRVTGLPTEENLILHKTSTLAVHAPDLVVESLPLGLGSLGIIFSISVINLIDQTKVVIHLDCISDISMSVSLLLT